MRSEWITVLIGLLVTCATGGAQQPVRGSTNAPSCVELRDQFDVPQRFSFPASKVVVLTIADRKGAEEVDGWIAALKPHYAGRVDFRGLANVAGVPGFLQGRVRRKFQETRRYPVMMDWSGTVCEQFGYQRGMANLLIIDRAGAIRARLYGSTSDPAVGVARTVLDAALSAPPAERPNPTPSTGQ